MTNKQSRLTKAWEPHDEYDELDVVLASFASVTLSCHKFDQFTDTA